uniref:Uncharacterized protein MANES_17G097600 n=1 Tax=Rhizophora mucronata TaxID=61149 RepID=A0A2P2KN54_RHIMU
MICLLLFFGINFSFHVTSKGTDYSLGIIACYPMFHVSQLAGKMRLLVKSKNVSNSSYSAVFFFSLPDAIMH